MRIFKITQKTIFEFSDDIKTIGSIQPLQNYVNFLTPYKKKKLLVP